MSCELGDAAAARGLPRRGPRSFIIHGAAAAANGIRRAGNSAAARAGGAGTPLDAAALESERQ